MTIPKVTGGDLYRANGYSREDEDAPLEIKPVGGDWSKSMTAFRQILGVYADVIRQQPYMVDQDGVMLWEKRANRTDYSLFAGVWIDDYLYLGNIYDDNWSHEDVNGTEVITQMYVCDWVMSRDLYEKLRIFLNR